MFIELGRVSATVTLGVAAEERIKPQTAELEIRAEIPDTVGSSDDLRSTINYVEIVNAVRESLRSKEFQLLEHAVHNVGTSLMRSFPLMRSVEVCMHKLRVPAPEMAGISVSVKRVFLRS